jgi:protein involved in polysaccharide export with SLBB domain
MSACASKEIKNRETRKSSESYETVRKSLEQSRIIAPGNVLSIHHSGDPKVTGTYKVDFEGRIHMPYKVVLRAGGLSTSALRDAISQAYQPYVKGSSTVSVEIKERNVLVEVRGEVKSPGRYLVRLDMPLEELVALAGGFASDPGSSVSNAKSPEFLGVERPKAEGDVSGRRESVWFHLTEYFYEYDTEPDLLWRGGEKIFFQASAPADAKIKNSWQSITVMGEVHEPKDIPVMPNADLLTYVSRAGGVSSSADLSQVEVIHRDTDTRETVNLIKNRMVNQLKAGDVIVIRAIDNRPSIIDKISSYALTLATITLSVAAIVVF